ncbi:MAG: DMT family transporter [Pseudomonadota bacterium]
MPHPLSASSPLWIYALGVALGCVVDAIVKGVTAEMAVSTLLAWRFFFGGGFAMAAYIHARKPAPSWPAIRFHTFRATIQLLAAFLFFWALTQRSLADVTVIGFTAALMLAPIARVVLGEKITGLSIGAALVGFAGATFAISAETAGAPLGGNRALGAAAGFASAFLYALTLVLVRLRAREEDTLTIVTFTNVIGGLLLLPMTVWTLPGMDWSDFPVLVFLGALGTGVWFLFTIAYANAPAQRLAPIEYTSLIWAALLGAVFFGEVPGWQLYIGAVIIIAACLLVAFESRFRTRSETSLPASELPD